MNQQNLSDFIWTVADLLRGNFKQSEFGRIILPFTVLRRVLLRCWHKNLWKANAGAGL